ncbi:MAG TPA: DUF1707 domain-containing protein [Acidimicrobiales bacterium]|nr:DUF1707 domain-containing protein [Acidimicrobiales bacterium]
MTAPAPDGAHLRIGDAERAAMADTLGRHYADGRLDEEELRERLGRASSAKTAGDLEGLLSDLPRLDGGGEPAEPPALRASHPHRQRRALRIAALVLAAMVLTHVAVWSWPIFLPQLFVAVALLAGLLWLRGRRRCRCW